MQFHAIFAIFLAALALPACGDDAPIQSTADAAQAGINGDAQVAQQGLTPVFLAVGGTATTGAVTIAGSSPDGAHVHVEIAINNFADLFGIAGHLHYDPAVLQLTAQQANGVPVGADNNLTDYKPRTVAKESPTGRILMGGARFSNVPTPFDTPTGAKVTREVWLVLDFNVLQKTPTSLAFDPNTLVVRNGAYTDVPTDWGQLQISWVQQGGAP